MLRSFGDDIVEEHSVSTKHYALYTYLGKLLRPVWDHDIIAEDDKGTPKSNSLIFVETQRKLDSLMILIERCSSDFVGSNQPH
jgi:hypothetical protein